MAKDYFCSLVVEAQVWIQDDQKREKQFPSWSSPQLSEQLHGLTDL